MAFEEYWNKWYKDNQTSKPSYDNWLDKYSNIIKNINTRILDLGCGLGNDSLYLIEKDRDVLACDYSKIALKQVKQNMPEVETQLVDISKTLPFHDGSFDLIIADLSLHYFDDRTTKKIMLEIKRILSSNGILLARVNSTEELENCADKGIKIEDNYYLIDGYNKRFFTVEDAKKYFSIIGNVKIIKTEMIRYSKPKKLLEIIVKI